MTAHCDGAQYSFLLAGLMIKTMTASLYAHCLRWGVTTAMSRWRFASWMSWQVEYCVVWAWTCLLTAGVSGCVYFGGN